MSESNSAVRKNKGEFDRYDIPESLIERLRSKGIEALFPVQYKTFNLVRSGYDLIVLARTGTGKTLAFALPIVSMLLSGPSKQYNKPTHPTVLILAPTRELVAQISTVFQDLCDQNLSVLTVYGGVPIGPQCASLRRGVDIIIGTPGRIIDLLERNVLNLEHVTQVVLDEVDRMLDMGFSHDVESIIYRLYPEKNKSEDTEDENSASSPQTLLFSATMPSWVSDVAQKYLSANTRRVSLVDKQDNKTATGVSHLALPCSFQDRADTMADVIRTFCKQKQSRCIVFCERKRDADELTAHSSMSSDCHVFHGDIPQDKRELILQKFREGKYRTLITTNVAARGLDIPEVDLVIQCHPPRVVGDYIHRSGRTGRAERSGTSVVFYTPHERYMLDLIEKQVGITFQRIAAPTLNDILESWGSDLISNFESIPKETWSVFVPIAQSLIEQLDDCKSETEANNHTNGHTPSSRKSSKSNQRVAELDDASSKLRTLCCALARLSGKDGAVESRSLINANKGFTTYKLELSTQVFRKGHAYTVLRQQLPENVLEAIKNMSFIKGHMGFVFDIPSTVVDTVNSTWSNDGEGEGVLEVLTKLPELEIEAHQFEQHSSNRGGGGGGRGFHSSWGGNRGGAGRGGGWGRGNFTSGRNNYNHDDKNKLSFDSRGSKRGFNSHSTMNGGEGGVPKKMRLD